MTEVECSLKAENYAVAARLDCSGRAIELLKVSAFWRALALKLKASTIGCPIPRDAAPKHIWLF